MSGNLCTRYPKFPKVIMLPISNFIWSTTPFRLTSFDQTNKWSVL